VVNNLLLSVILGIVLIGTLYPIVAAAFGTQLSVGHPFFDSTVGPIALVLVAMMAIGPLLRWRRDNARAGLRRVAIPAAVSAVTLIALLAFARGIHLLPLLGLALAAGVAVASVAPLWGRDLRRTPLFTYGMVIAHLGIAVSLAGMAAESAFNKETLVATRIGEPQQVGPYTVTLTGVRPVIGVNWSAVEGVLRVERGSGAPVILRPQSRFFSTPPQETNESAIRTVVDGQLYTVLGHRDDAGRWQLRLWWKPLVTLIWLGGALVALGGALSLLGRVRRERRARRGA
jgi:cytochrome c-type biogenesis protein CcmF